MNGLNQVLRAVVTALEGAGLRALPAYEGAAKKYDAPVAAVAVESAAGKAMGLCGYLGERYDEETGSVIELYGKQLSVTISVEIRAPGAAACETAMETAMSTLLDGLPAGLRPGEAAWSALSWDRESGMFLRRGTLACRAAFTAQSGSEEGVFLDFILKGTVQN